jgi:hypothetical protein
MIPLDMTLKDKTSFGIGFDCRDKNRRVQLERNKLD